MKDEFKAVQKFGPGGYKCFCCGPSPKDRQANRKLARTRLKQKDLQRASDEG